MRKIKNISVLMSVYNDSEFIFQSVKSVLNQTYKEFEFIIIDDGSEDNTEEIISTFKDERIVYKKISHRGLASALNYGLNISSGEWIARIDADDLNTKVRLQKQINFLNSERGSDTDVVSSSSVYFNEKNKILFVHKPPSEDSEIKKFLNLHNPLNHSSVIFRKELIVSNGAYDKKFLCYEDFQLWLRLKDKARFYILKDVLVYNRLRKNSLMNTGDTNNIYNLLFSDTTGKLSKDNSKTENNILRNNLFWIEYFYGSKKEARKYFTDDITFRKSLAYLNTFLPEDEFRKLKDKRLRLRIKGGIGIDKKYKQELKSLLI